MTLPQWSMVTTASIEGERRGEEKGEREEEKESQAQACRDHHHPLQKKRPGEKRGSECVSAPLYLP